MMTIAQMTSGAPIVDVRDGMVALYAENPENDPEGRYHGFMFHADCAVTVAARLLAGANELAGDDIPMLPVRSVEAEHAVLDDGEEAVKLILNVEGAAIPLFLDLTRFAELAAGCAQLSREIDAGQGFGSPA